MDPTAPKDNPPGSPKPPAADTPPNPWSSSTPAAAAPKAASAGPIQPGQFVAVGDDTPAPLPDALPSLAQTSSPSTPAGPILGATPPPAPQPPQPPSPPLPIQPDPTPYVAPREGQASQTPPSGGTSKIKQLRLVIIVAGILTLTAIIAALVWFFVLGGKPNQAAKTKSASDLTEISVPSPLPKSTQGGFGNLPQGTESATPSAR